MSIQIIALLLNFLDAEFGNSSSISGRPRSTRKIFSLLLMGSEEDDELLVEEALIQRELSGLYTGDGSVGFDGEPVLKSNTGNWRACPFILGNECCERLAYYGISRNLVIYLTKKLHEGNVSAARNVSTWQGTCYLTPIIGAVLADAYWGKYWTIAAFSTIYFIVLLYLNFISFVDFM